MNRIGTICFHNAVLLIPIYLTDGATVYTHRRPKRTWCLQELFPRNGSQNLENVLYQHCLYNI